MLNKLTSNPKRESLTDGELNQSAYTCTSCGFVTGLIDVESGLCIGCVELSAWVDIRAAIKSRDWKAAERIYWAEPELIVDAACCSEVARRRSDVAGYLLNESERHPDSLPYLESDRRVAFASTNWIINHLRRGNCNG